MTERETFTEPTNEEREVYNRPTYTDSNQQMRNWQKRISQHRFADDIGGCQANYRNPSDRN